MQQHQFLPLMPVALALLHTRARVVPGWHKEARAGLQPLLEDQEEVMLPLEMLYLAAVLAVQALEIVAQAVKDWSSSHGYIYEQRI
jgi:hypothetical protein